MVVAALCARIKLIFLSVLGLFRRALCCFSRRRRRSNSDSEILTNVNVVSAQNYTGQRKNDVERDWNSWDDSPRTVEEHIEQYRKTLVAPSEPADTQTDIDFFQDMTPKIKKQTKILINPQQPTVNFSRLEASLDAPIVADLEDWVDDEPQQTGWEECDDERTKLLIREKKKEIRAQKQQQKVKSQTETSGFVAERLPNNSL